MEGPCCCETSYTIWWLPFRIQPFRIPSEPVCDWSVRNVPRPWCIFQLIPTYSKPNEIEKRQDRMKMLLIEECRVVRLKTDFLKIDPEWKSRGRLPRRAWSRVKPFRRVRRPSPFRLFERDFSSNDQLLVSQDLQSSTRSASHEPFFNPKRDAKFRIMYCRQIYIRDMASPLQYTFITRHIGKFFLKSVHHHTLQSGLSPVHLRWNIRFMDILPGEPCREHFHIKTRSPLVFSFFEKQTSTWYVLFNCVYCTSNSQWTYRQYVAADPITLDAVVVDPVLDFDPISGAISTTTADCVLDFIERKGLHILRVL